MFNAGKNLFSDRPIHEVFDDRVGRVKKDVAAIAPDVVRASSAQDLAAQLSEKYLLACPNLQVGSMAVEPSEVQIDMTPRFDDDPLDRWHHFDHHTLGRSRSRRPERHLVPGHEVAFAIPFVGSPEVFQCEPSQFKSTHPKGIVKDGELRLVYRMTDTDTPVRPRFDRDLAEIEEWLGWLKGDVDRGNDRICTWAKNELEARQKRLAATDDLVGSLGLPIRRRADAPAVHQIPPVRRKAIVHPAPGVRDPYIEMAEYETILGIMRSLVSVMERSPRSFAGLDETVLRDFLLMTLNGQYDGAAMAEAFNGNGKTDILVRVGDRNVFIAECKFWSGPKSLAKAIDQLLGYTCWRDTKIAVVLFNRSRNFSRVLAQAAGVLKAHPNHSRSLDYPQESGCRAVLTHPSDPARELILTVLVFDVPKGAPTPTGRSGD